MGRVIWQRDCIESDTPYYAEAAGIHIRNLDEMKYYLQKYFYLIEDDFFDEGLIRFFSDGLNRPDLGRLISLSRGKSNPCIIVSKLIISIGDDSEEIQNIWRKKASEYMRLPEADRQLKKADTLYQLNQHALAEGAYKNILKMNEQGRLKLTNEEAGRICYRLGFLSLESLSWKSAGSYLQEAYGLLGYEAVLKELYILSCMSPEVICDGTLFQDISPRSLRDWRQEYEQKRDSLMNTYSLAGYEQLSNGSVYEEKENPVRDLLDEWRADYRKIRKNSCQETDFSV